MDKNWRFKTAPGSDWSPFTWTGTTLSRRTVAAAAAADRRGALACTRARARVATRSSDENIAHAFKNIN